MIDRTALLATLKPLVAELEDSIRARVLADAGSCGAPGARA